jgi:hypothetical protein
VFALASPLAQTSDPIDNLQKSNPFTCTPSDTDDQCFAKLVAARADTLGSLVELFLILF